MLGTTPVKQYFSSGSTHHVTPAVSAEWNYNLFYTPLTTFSGDGSQVSLDWTNADQWTATGSSVSNEGVGRFTTAYPSPHSSLKLSTINQAGAAKINVSVPNGLNTYKVVFFARVNQDTQVTLSAQTYIDSHRSSTTSVVLDSAIWTRVEVLVSSRPVDTPYSNFTLTLDYTAIDTSFNEIDIFVDQLQIYQTSIFDYQYGNLWPTSAPFTHFRPGESYVPSGNSLTPLPNNFRRVSTDLSTSKTWPTQMPISPAVFHPRLLGLANSNPLYKNGMVSDYSTYRYFVSDIGSPYLGGVYDQILNTNKIVLKFNVAYGKPSAFTVALSNTVTGYSRSISLTDADVDDSGLCILYLQVDGSWASRGTWSTMPAFNLAGDIRFGIASQVEAYQPINKIVLHQTSFSINSNFASSSDVAHSDMSRLQVVEISPRLEVDLTYFLMTFDTTSELDNKQSPLPISAISSNSATIELSNVPLVVSNNVLSLFSNNSSTSPLKGLFKKNVKFYINYVIQDAVSGTTPADRVLPGGVWYAESWDNKDIEKVTVNLFDITKYLQFLSPTDYVCQSENIFNVISNILDMSGFTDYDYDSLRKVSLRSTSINGSPYVNSQPIIASYFYCDSTQQKVFDVLREIFEAYQIGAYIDTYGVMKFLNLDQILSNQNSDLIVHDSTLPKVMVTPENETLLVSPNIITDTYTETIKTKIGQATIKYKIPQNNKTLDPSGTGLKGPTAVRVIDKNDVLWTLDKDDALTFNYLYSNIDTISQNYFNLDPNDVLNPFTQWGVDHDGYAIIEGEIVSFADKEYSFTITQDANPSSVTPTISTGTYSSIISNSNDLKAAIATYSAEAGFTGQIQYYPTGKIANVQRGLFNSPVRTHKIITNKSDLDEKATILAGSNCTIANHEIIMPANPGEYSILVPKDDSGNHEVSYDYHTYSTKMVIGPNAVTPNDGAGGGIVVGLDGANPVYVEIRQDFQKKVINKKGVSVPSYRLYVYKNQDEKQSLLSVPYYDVTASLLNQSDVYPSDSPFAEFGKVVNLKFVVLPPEERFIVTSATGSYKSPAFEIYLNKHKINIQTQDVIIDTTGTFGIFAHSAVAGSIGSIPFTEIYACQTALDSATKQYHYELESFANTIASKNKTFEINYMLQTRPMVVGINYYDVQYSLAPAINAYPVPISYSWYYWTPAKGSAPGPVTTANGTTAEVQNHIIVNEDALNYSGIYHSGFRGRFAVINSSPSSIWLKKTPDTTNSIDVSFMVNTNDAIQLSAEQSISQVFDPANMSESITINSNWVQSKTAAIGILRNIFRALDGFSRDTQISIYGNPLVQIGDVVTIDYNLKNIQNTNYFVQGVKQTFNSGLETILTLNQISNTPTTPITSAPPTTTSTTPPVTPPSTNTPTATGYITPTSTGSGTNGLPAPYNIYYDAAKNWLYWLPGEGAPLVEFAFDNVDYGFAQSVVNPADNHISMGLFTEGSGPHIVKLQSRANDKSLGGYVVCTIVY